MNLFPAILPELILVIAACALFLIGVIDKPGARRFAAALMTASLVGAFAVTAMGVSNNAILADALHNFRIGAFGLYIKMITAGVGIVLSLLMWPNNREATGNGSLNYGTEAAEFFALVLLSLAGVFIVAGANDIILLFLGIELASIPTYIMVSTSRPLPVAQEAGVKYFFLGAMSAAIMLFGFSYLYGTTGLTSLDAIAGRFAATLSTLGATAVTLSSWQMLAVVMLIAGFAFKMAAVPLHFYAGDVYQGAATPLTALLSFVPKISGFVALIKVLYAVGGSAWALPTQVANLLWIMAVLTMTAGNILGLLQQNVKRLLAYSSIAHTGYMLVGIATLAGQHGQAGGQWGGQPGVETAALRAVLFYLASYGLMNAATFGVLMLLPAKPRAVWERDGNTPITGSAETFDDLAGAGIKNIGLGLAMAIACFSLTGLPLTVGFFGKFYLIQAAWRGGMTWLVLIMMVNAAISAAYYLRIVGTMFLKPETPGGIEPAIIEGDLESQPTVYRSMPITLAIGVSSFATLALGIFLPATEMLSNAATNATAIDRPLVSSPSETGEAPVEPSANAVNVSLPATAAR